MCLFCVSHPTLQLQIGGLESDEAIQKARDAVGSCVVAAVLLKTWLRELPDSIVPQVRCGLPSYRMLVS
jgi:hypothetical protein